MYEIMRAISIKQPFASLIKDGVKLYEFRSWQTTHRGDILVCSGKKPHWDCMGDHSYPIGCSICIVTITEILLTEDIPKNKRIVLNPLNRIDTIDPLSIGLTYAWKLENPRPVHNIPITGQLGLFTVANKFKTSR
jgi:hypothetical protein